MAIHEIQAPDGQIHQVEAPDNATPEQVVSFFQQSYKPAGNFMGIDAGAIANNIKSQQPSEFTQHSIDNFKGAVQAGKDLVSGDYWKQLGNNLSEGVSNLGDIATNPQLRQDFANQNFKRTDYTDALSNGFNQSPSGKIFGAIGGTVLNTPSTIIGNYANPAIAKATGLSPNEVGLVEMAAPGVSKLVPEGVKSVVSDAASKVGNVIGDAGRTIKLNYDNSPLSDNAGGGFKVPGKAAPQSAADFVNPVGRAAIDAYNKSYGAAKDAVNNAETLVRQSPVAVPAPDFADVTGSLIGKIKNGLGQGNEGLVSDLSDIINGISQRSVSRDAYGQPTANKVISTNDLIDARKAVNDLLTSNQFPKTGTGSVLQLKGYIDSLIDTAKANSPDFAKTYEPYRQAATDIASKFTGNKSLKPFWQPEDYVAAKGFENGNSATAYNDTTLTRANKFLDNLNTKDTGKITAAIKALPPEMQGEVLKAAAKKAAENGAAPLWKNVLLGLKDIGTGLDFTSAGQRFAKEFLGNAKPNYVGEFYKAYKKNPQALSLDDAFQQRKNAALIKQKNNVK